ncbi:hypothetical protein [Paenibacillus sedimenti]|uniref:Glycerophosphoryl diester phosphodiesterase membrane domain-containing protein n=1 Tax=Paenibacillus sedimenti TaxID=2770274 RepID=A0A926KUZ3_9BACL|nr:hypothetical protein [Paenibacillus sedimenti]MBD0383656.1 hypothetical protein [Paenibacillus sedimenti]
MLNTPLRPMGIGRILDRSFQLYRKHFVKLTLVMLILYGPFYLLQHLLLYQEAANTTVSILDQIRTGASWQEILQSGSAFRSAASGVDVWKTLLFTLVLLPLFLLGLMPASVASVVHLVKANLLGEEIPGATQMLKKSFRRFWPLAGSTVLDLLIMVGMYIGFALIVIVLVMIFVFGAGISNAVGGGAGGLAVFGIIFFIVLGLAVIVTWSYFFIRWVYYLPFVALGEDSIGLGHSWRLTRKNFWRLFLMYVVLTLILYLFLVVIELIIAAVFGMGLGGQLLTSLVSILVSPLWLLPYAISFFDLKVRNEGLGLDSLINNMVHNDEIEPTNEEAAPEKDAKPEDADKKNE